MQDGSKFQGIDYVCVAHKRMGGWRKKKEGKEK